MKLIETTITESVYWHINNEVHNKTVKDVWENINDKLTFHIHKMTNIRAIFL